MKDKYEQYDVIAGPIADDRMNIAIRRFEEDALTDVALMHCLSYVQYGTQYVLKTSEACSKVDILNYHALDDKEIDHISRYAELKRMEGKNVVRNMGREYRAEGYVLSELIEQFKTRDTEITPSYEEDEYDER